MYGAVKQQIAAKLAEIRESGLHKDERIILGPQGAEIKVAQGGVINFCANNYLGLSSNGALINAARSALDQWGFGLSSVRFICGTQTIHTTLEEKVSGFLGTDATILYTSCFDANAGLFETLLDAECAIISDSLNHASIIDGIRLCKAARHRYKHSDMDDLQACLEKSADAKIRMIATDGVFSMDGHIANLADICDLADKHNALVMVDDSHATGFVGKTGRGTHEHCGVEDRVDIITTTFGKALGGASGGCTSGRQEIVDLLRQRSRPYLFSNTMAPAIVGAAIEAIEMLGETTMLRDQLHENTERFRAEMTAAGFDITPGVHPIVPIMLGDAKLAQQMASQLLDEGIYVIGFSFPVVPQGQARIRVQISAAHTEEHLDSAVAAFSKVGKALGIIE